MPKHVVRRTLSFEENMFCGAESGSTHEKQSTNSSSVKSRPILLGVASTTIFQAALKVYMGAGAITNSCSRHPMVLP